MISPTLARHIESWTPTWWHTVAKEPFHNLSIAGLGLSWRCLGALLLITGPAGAQSDSPAEEPVAQGGTVSPAAVEGRPVKAVEIAGNELLGETYIRGFLHTRAGQPYSEEQVQADVRRLLKTGKFQDVLASHQVENGEVILTFTVREKPAVADVQFQGNKKFKEKDLLEQLDFGAGDPMDRLAIDQGQENIERLYREAGYADVQVELDEEVLRDEGVALYRITEGPRVKLRRILFQGNSSFPAHRLQGKIGTKTYMWLLRTGAYEPEQVERDEATLRNFYRDEGFLDARVSHQRQFSDDRKDLTLTFVIEEGPRYAVKSIRFTGTAVFTEDELAGLIGSQVGAFLNLERVRSDVKAIRTRYGEEGYIYATVTAKPPVYDEEPGFVHLTMDVNEGQQYRIGRIVVRGNRQTKDKVVRRELRFFPEELYNTTKMEQAERRLVETRLFTDATITPVGEEPGLRDALVDVTENERTRQVLVGVGVTSNSGVIASFMLQSINFDLFDWPRDFNEFIRGRAFRGAGQTLRFQVEPGTELTRMRLDFREPYLLDKPISFGTSFYVFERGRDAYDEERIGMNISFGRRFHSGPLEGWAGEIALRTEWVDIGGVDFGDADDIRDARGGSYLGTVKGTLVHDTTDSRFIPSRGHRFQVSYEQAGALGGDHFFGKLLASYAQHKTLRTDVFDRKSILTMRSRGGYIFGDAPVFERFYAGGIGSIRGFEFRGVSPRQGFDDDRVGGDFMLLAGADYSFPIYGKTLRGVLFTDMGTVEKDFGINSWRVALGFGLRVYVDFFGPIPLEFDFAIPLSTDPDDDEQVFSFFFGTTF